MFSAALKTAFGDVDKAVHQSPGSPAHGRFLDGNPVFILFYFKTYGHYPTRVAETEFLFLVCRAIQQIIEDRPSHFGCTGGTHGTHNCI